MKILIYEDNKNDALKLCQCIDNFFKTKKIKYEIRYCSNKDELLQNIESYDLMFLDVELGNENGIEIGKELLTKNIDCRIILTSNYSKYLIDGYKIHADRYFLKPINQEEFNIEMQSVIKRYFNNFLGIFNPKICKYKIYFKDILFIEHQNRKTYIHLLNAKVIECTYPLKYWLEKIADQPFAQSHKAFIVNLNYISGYKNNHIILYNNVLIPLSRHFKNSFELSFKDNLHTII